MELVNIISGRFTGRTVGSYTPPDLILNDQHTDFFQLIAQLLNVEAHQTILNIHIGSVVKQFQRTLNIDFQGGRYMVGFLSSCFRRASYKSSRIGIFSGAGLSKYLW